MNSKIKVLIVDDHLIFRNGLKLLLNDIPNVELIGSCSNGMDLLDSLQNMSPDIVLIDIQMPVMDGVEAIKIASDKYPGIYFIVLSTFYNEEYLVRLMELGIKGYLLKNADALELSKAIQLVNEGKNYYSVDLLPFITNSFIKKRINEEEQSSLLGKLSKREIEIMQLICKGFTNKEIAEKCFISPRTVGGHRSNLLEKTGCKNTADMVYVALSKNLIPMETPKALP